MFSTILDIQWSIDIDLKPGGVRWQMTYKYQQISTIYRN